MKSFQGLFGLLIFCSSCSAYGQVNCTKASLVGKWRQVESIPGIHPNVDSLKKAISDSPKTIGTLNLKSDSTYTYSFLGTTDRKKNKRYILDKTTCEIILGTKGKARKRSNLEIIYFDGHYLIFKEDDNPKGYVTHLLVKM